MRARYIPNIRLITSLVKYLSNFQILRILLLLYHNRGYSGLSRIYLLRNTQSQSFLNLLRFYSLFEMRSFRIFFFNQKIISNLRIRNITNIKKKTPQFRKFSIKKRDRGSTHHPGTSSGSSQAPLPSASPILNTVPIGHPYSLAIPSRHM